MRQLWRATLYRLRIPFVESFAHARAERHGADSIVLRVQDCQGHVGFGEGIARPYVTGETADSVCYHIQQWWPMLRRQPLPRLDLAALEEWIPVIQAHPSVTHHASVCALTTAVLDCLLHGEKRSLSSYLSPKRKQLIYSGVITAGTLAQTIRHAKRMALLKFCAVKMKVGFPDDVVRVRAVRDILGPNVSLRLDANGAFTLPEACRQLVQFAPFHIDAIEQPIARGSVTDLVILRQQSPIPIMADESLITLDDATLLAQAQAVDWFNLRLNKCGGLYRTLRMAEIGQLAGIKMQVGCQVGETAILSALGRHLAAHLSDMPWLEGSFGNLLLTEDIATQSIRFGHQGKANGLDGTGLGIVIDEARLAKYTVKQWELV